MILHNNKRRRLRFLGTCLKIVESTAGKLTEGCKGGNKGQKGEGSTGRGVLML